MIMQGMNTDKITDFNQAFCQLCFKLKDINAILNQCAKQVGLKIDAFRVYPKGRRGDENSTIYCPGTSDWLVIDDITFAGRSANGFFDGNDVRSEWYMDFILKFGKTTEVRDSPYTLRVCLVDKVTLSMKHQPRVILL